MRSRFAADLQGDAHGRALAGNHDSWDSRAASVFVLKERFHGGRVKYRVLKSFQ